MTVGTVLLISGNDSVHLLILQCIPLLRLIAAHFTDIKWTKSHGPFPSQFAVLMSKRSTGLEPLWALPLQRSCKEDKSHQEVDNLIIRNLKLLRNQLCS